MSSLQAESLFTVAGKVVLVTGGSRGIGKMVSMIPARKAQPLMFPDCLCFCQKRRDCESADSWYSICVKSVEVFRYFRSTSLRVLVRTVTRLPRNFLPSVQGRVYPSLLMSPGFQKWNVWYRSLKRERRLFMSSSTMLGQFGLSPWMSIRSVLSQDPHQSKTDAQRRMEAFQKSSL